MTSRAIGFGLAILLLTLAGCAHSASTAAPSSSGADHARSAPLPAPQARSVLDGRGLRWPLLTAAERATMEAELAQARARHDAEPESEDAIVWLGRRLAYLGRIDEAIAAYSAGLDIRPRSVRLLRHRGHRFITIRDFPAAYDDLLTAARILAEDEIPDEPEPDGRPNAQATLLSTLHGNILYHLGLAAYLKGDIAQAASIWGDAMRRLEMSDESRVSFLYWRYLALRRIDSTLTARDELAALPDPSDLLENHAYARALRFFRGAMTESELLGSARPGSIDEAVILYALATGALASGERDKGAALLERILASDPWPAFAATAAEADLARLRGLPPAAPEHH